MSRGPALRVEPLPGDVMKVCRKCKQERPKAAYSAHRAYKDNLNPWCCVCRREYNRKKYEERQKKRGDDPLAEKRCVLCLEVLTLENFTTRTAMADGLESHCKPCREKATQKIGPVMLDPDRPTYHGKGRKCKKCHQKVNGYTRPTKGLGLACGLCVKAYRDKQIEDAQTKTLATRNVLGGRQDGIVLKGLSPLMKRRKVTSAALAEYLDLSHYHIKDVRQKRKRMAEEHLEKIAEYLGCSIKELTEEGEAA